MIYISVPKWFWGESNTRDMSEVMSHLKKATSWKTAPVAESLARYAPLYEKLVELSPNAVLPPKKTAMALLSVHKRKPINFTHQKNVDWADDMGQLPSSCSGTTYYNL